jgi:tetratricopeptide (TPR) repeat protein
MERLRERRDRADQARRAMRQRQRVVNLRPLDVTHTFKDRLREMRALCDHLVDASVRLISIVGRGGMGKTALASRVLADLERGTLPLLEQERELPIDGILYLSARGIGISLERIYADVGRMLGEPTASKLATRWASRDASLAAKIEYLLEMMQNGLYLILLDNLEDELAEDGTIREEGLRLFVERCLTQPSGAHLIATSREQIKIAAAALRGARSIPLREGLPEDEAIALLRDLDPDGVLGLRDASEQDLRQAARLTQGIPRALEILAGILYEDHTASLPQMLADESLLGKQVVEQLVAQGYQRLGQNERRVMEALAVFDRSIEETAIVYLLHPWFPGMDVQSSLRHLARGYFASANRVTGEYCLHPLDREYAYRQLPDDKEPAQNSAEGPALSKVEGTDAYNRPNLELRAADFYASIRKPESEWKSIDDLAPQLAEFKHCVRAKDFDSACRLLELIESNHLFLWGYYSRIVELREQLVGKLSTPELQSRNLASLANAYRGLGQLKRSIDLYEQALVIVQKLDDPKEEALYLGDLGNAYRYLGQYEKAARFYKYALEISRETGDRRGENIQLGRLGLVYRGLGKQEQAIEFYEQALNIVRELGEYRGEHILLGRLGVAFLDLGKVQQAIELHELVLAVAREISDRQYEGVWLGYLGKAFHRLGQIEQAIEFRKQALAIARQIGDRWGESYQLPGLAKTLLASGDLSRARQCCEDALAFEGPTTSYETTLTLAIVLLHQCDPAASDFFVDTVNHCRILLDKAVGLYAPRYALSAALVGQAICDPCWSDESQQAQLLAPALVEYRRALEICAAPGVVGDAMRDLELIRASGIEGLEPVFELLENAKYEPDLPKNLPDILEEME